MNKVLLFNPRSAKYKPRIPNSILSVAAAIEGLHEYVIVDGNMETDSWEKIALYDNKVIEALSTSTGKNDEYKVHIKVSAGKTYTDSSGNDKPAPQMNDYIDIGVFAPDSKNKEGRTQTNPLYLKKHKLTAGQHTIDIIVKGKPVRVGIDPYGKLMDGILEDNVKNL